jgi:serine/threonine-protein kinase
MGEVYKARDTKLGREVAIKVLPEAFAENKERLARFEREARLLASLNHPNIATIHGLEESDGTHFLVLEFVRGETLAERIKRGPIAVDEALPLFKQIAEGLEAAHEKGVIHRDLKPANIKVTPEGKVKVLDFGLAKAMQPEEPVADSSQSPTLTKDTALGAIMGTAAYMSPEQARGKAVDKRTDVWAFGCCLYESITGKEAFKGETVSDTIGAILRAEPEWNLLPDSTPSSCRRLLDRCLRKDAATRLQDIGDARLEIDEAKAGSEALPSLEEASWKRWLTIPRLASSFAIVAVAAALLAWYFARSETASSGAVTRASMVFPEDAAMPYEVGSFALSPDGRHLVYIGGNQKGTWQLYVRDLDTNQVRPLPGTNNADRPFFSPDGSWLAFNSEGFVKKVSLRGGILQKVCETRFSWHSWGVDDKIYFDVDGIVAVPATGGSIESVTQLDKSAGEFGHWTSKLLPDGKALIYTVYSGGSLNDTTIAIQSLDSGVRRTIISPGFDAHYLPTGHIVYVHGRSLMAVPFDLDRKEVTGEPVLVHEDVLVDFWTARAAAAWSNDGSFVFLEGNYEDTLVRVDRSGREESLFDVKGLFFWPRLSSDGRRMAVTVVDRNNPDIWVGDLDRGTMTRLTFGGDSLQSVWAPGDDWMVYRTYFDEHTNLYRKAADGSREQELLLSTSFDKAPSSFSPDARYLAYTEYRQGDSGISLLPLGDQGEPHDFLNTPFFEGEMDISPDGNWAAYHSDESGAFEVYVRPFPEGGEKIRVSLDGGQFPVWSRDGKELFYQNEGKLLAVSIKGGPRPQISTPHVVLESKHKLRAIVKNYDVFPDGQSFLMIKTKHPAYTTELHVIFNWFEELKRLVPTEN